MHMHILWNKAIYNNYYIYYANAYILWNKAIYNN